MYLSLMFVCENCGIVSRNLFKNAKKLCYCGDEIGRHFVVGMSSRLLVKVERMKNVLLIGLNRAEKRNAVNPQVATELTAAVEQLERDDDLRVGVLYGEGGNFCSGYDLSEVSKFESVKAIVPPGAEEQGLGFMGPTRRFIKKPLIGAVTGFAVAGGFELALMCDMRVIDDSTIFGFYNRKHGVPLIDGGTVRLPALIGLSRALDLIMTGRQVNAREAFELGIANRLVPTGAALGQAVQLANSLASRPQGCLQADRRAAYYATFNAASITKALEFEFVYSANVIQTEAVKGAKVFIESKKDAKKAASD